MQFWQKAHILENNFQSWDSLSHRPLNIIAEFWFISLLYQPHQSDATSTNLLDFSLNRTYTHTRENRIKYNASLIFHTAIFSFSFGDCSTVTSDDSELTAILSSQDINPPLTIVTGDNESISILLTQNKTALQQAWEMFYYKFC